MRLLNRASQYVVITPAKDEAKYIESTLESLVSQTVKPLQWVIVDDGSCDRTPQLIEAYRRRYPWITVLRLERDRVRKPGLAVISAFNAGLELVQHLEFDFIVKLDGDLQLPPTYFESLFLKFSEDAKLGICSGQYMERHGAEWRAIEMPQYHAAGASKIIRRECFRQINGFVPSRGWDTVDEIRAQTLGWNTTHYPDIKFQHLKNEGSGIGQLRTSIMHGEIYYLTGGGVLFFLLKLAQRVICGRPIILCGFAMLWGYCKAQFLRPRLVNPAEASHYRGLLNNRVRNALSPIFRSISLVTPRRSNS